MKTFFRYLLWTCITAAASRMWFLVSVRDAESNKILLSFLAFSMSILMGLLCLDSAFALFGKTIFPESERE